MRRLFWMGVGAAGAVVLARRAKAAVRRFTPEGVAEQASDAGRRVTDALRDAVTDFRTARAERETELVTALLAEPEGGTVAERRAARASAGATPARPTGDVRPDDIDEDEFF